MQIASLMSLEKLEDIIANQCGDSRENLTARKVTFFKLYVAPKSYRQILFSDIYFGCRGVCRGVFIHDWTCKTTSKKQALSKIN